jgi:hypothetical protein
MNIRSFKKIFCLLIILLFMGVFSSYAQPSDDPPGNPPVPIAGIGYLLALGGAFGIKKIYDQRKRDNLK